MRESESMTDGLKQSYRTAIVNLLRSNERVERAVIFGSRALGTYSQGSDVDIALFGTALTFSDQLQLNAMMEALTVPQRVDLVVYNRIEDAPLKEHIRRYGIELYRRENLGSAA